MKEITLSCQVSAKGWFIAMISTTVETDNPEAEIQPGLNLLGPITQKFIQVKKYKYEIVLHDLYRLVTLLSQQMMEPAANFSSRKLTTLPRISRPRVWMSSTSSRGEPEKSSISAK